MPVFLKFTIFVLLCLLAVAGVATSLLVMPEGVSGALISLGTALLFALLGYAWHRLHPPRLAANGGRGGLYVPGLVVVAVVAVYFGYLGVASSLYEVRASIFTSKITITAHEESPIQWPGFEGPVGVRVQVDVSYPLRLDGYFRSPRVLTGGEVLQAELGGQGYWQYCDKPVVDNVACLRFPHWPMASHPVLDGEKQSRLVFELYPSNLFYLESPERLCLRGRYPYTSGGFIASPPKLTWHFVSNGREIELGHLLDQAIRGQGGLLDSPEKLQGILARLQYGELQAAGYQACDIKTAIRFNEETECFCRQ